MTLPQYLDGIGKAEAALKDMAGWTPRYRFPFLKRRPRLKNATVCANGCKPHHYQAGDVTIDASDWYYNQLFKQYSDKNDTVALLKLKKLCGPHVDRANTTMVFGSENPQILAQTRVFAAREQHQCRLFGRCHHRIERAGAS